MNQYFPDFAAECRVCGYVFKNFRKLVEHQQEVHPKIREGEF